MKKLAIIFFGVFALATSAQATVYDFVAATTALGEGAYSNLGGDDLAALAGLEATGTSGGGTTFAYLDGPSNGGFPGGLGVCDARVGGIGSACTNSGHDSIAIAEADILKITLLGNNRQITDITFNPGGTHGPSSVLNGLSVDYQLTVGGLAQGWNTATFDGLTGLIDMIVGVNSIELAESAANSQEFYVASMTVVPLPAAVWLFGTAMLGLFGLRRKTKMEALAA